MKLRVGKHKFGHVPDEKVKAHKPTRQELIHEMMLGAIENLIRRFVSSEKDKERIRRLLK